MGPMKTCSRCNGAGRLVAKEWDEFGPLTCPFPCEECDGSGHLDTCRRCLDVRPLSELELNPARLCGDCAAAAVMRDDESEARELRRVG